MSKRYGAKWPDVLSFAATAMRCELGVACVDLDSVLIYHEGAWGNSRLGPPLLPGRRLCKILKRKKYRVVVLTARPDGHCEIKDYLLSHNIPVDEVTNIKPAADVYFDDKAFRIRKNWK